MLFSHICVQIDYAIVMKTLEQYRDQWGCQSCNDRTSRYSMHGLQFILAQLDLLQAHIILT